MVHYFNSDWNNAFRQPVLSHAMHSDNNAFTVIEIIASRDYVTIMRFTH